MYVDMICFIEEKPFMSCELDLIDSSSLKQLDEDHVENELTRKKSPAA